MRRILIPKKVRGQFRKVYVPNTEEKTTLREILGNLQDKESRICNNNVHGFIPGKSPVTNAIQHIGYKFTTCFDLKDFFDTVDATKLKGLLSKEELQTVLVDGIAGQGLPTSPTVANLAASKLDTAINNWISKSSLEVTYTRYADDLSFSYNHVPIMKLLCKKIPEIVGTCGFKVNKDKTRTQCSYRGNRVITGVSVGNTEIGITRNIKRKIRAARHQNNETSLAGLLEYAKLKQPRNRDEKHSYRIKHEVKKLYNAWNINKDIFVDKIIIQPDIKIGNNVYLTKDPVYLMSPSNWFCNNYKTCLKHPSGSNRGLSLGYMYCEGVYLAVMYGYKTKINHGVVRKSILARTFVFHGENGEKVHTEVYGADYKNRDILMDCLKNNNYTNKGSGSHRMIVKGDFPENFGSYYNFNFNRKSF